MKTDYTVGRNDGAGQVFRFGTLREAEEKVAEIERLFPKEVRNGEFYLDGPEEGVNSTSPKLVQTGWRSDGSSPSEPSTGLRDATQMTLLELTDIAREVEVVLPQAAEVIREIRDKLQKFGI